MNLLNAVDSASRARTRRHNPTSSRNTGEVVTTADSGAPKAIVVKLPGVQTSEGRSQSHSTRSRITTHQHRWISAYSFQQPASEVRKQPFSLSWPINSRSAFTASFGTLCVNHHSQRLCYYVQQRQHHHDITICLLPSTRIW